MENVPLTTLILTNGKPAVELSFKLEHGDYILSGHLDQVAEMNGQLWLLDHKTTKNSLGDYYFAQYNPNNQIYLYAAACHIILAKPLAGVLINAVQIAKGFIRTVRWPVHITPTQREDWLKEVTWWLDLAADCARKENWPRNDKSCFLCQFKRVCGKDPSVRDQFLSLDFEQNPWNPAANR